MSNLTSEQLKALDLSKHTIVTANAGSGKTFILTKRFIETIRQKKIRYNQIVAITFTEKAAAELLARISNEIDEFLNQNSLNISAIELKKIKEFREHILSAKISTIHSFCFDLLKEFPVEAGIDPSTEIIEDLYKRELIERSIEEILIENINDESVREILRIFGKETTISQLQSLIEKRYFTDQIIQNIYQVDSENVNPFENYFEYIIQTAREYFKHSYFQKFKYARDLLPQIKDEITLKKGKDELIETISNLEKIFDDFLGDLDFEKLNFIFEAVITSLLNKDFSVKKSNFKNADESWAISQFQKIFFGVKDFYKNVVWEKEFEKEKYRLSLTLIDLYKRAKEKFHQFKTLEGVLDFDDLLILTDKLLENNQIRNNLKNRFIFILVDEFQDTDVIQFNIIKKISENFESDNNVFVVGDEKQSIYGFRNAQLSVFQNFKNYLRIRQDKNNDASVVTLSTSYRSSPSIAAFVNFIFSNLWAKINSSSQVYNYHQIVEYSPLQIGREKFSDESIVFLVSNEENQSHKVANYILHLIDSNKEIFDRNEQKFRKINFGDIALLFRTRAEIKEFENVFIEKNIPFVVSGGRGYYQSEEIQDWINYLNFLSNPKNDSALIEILRSPFFAVSDNQLFQISLQEGNSFFEKLKNYSHNHTEDNFIKTVLENLELHLKIASRYSIPELIQTILKDTLYYGNIDHHPKKSQMIANVEKLINVAHNFESKGFEDLKTFSSYLKEAFEKEESSEAIISELRGSVQLMTMHQAKGLEFPIVILPNFEKEFRNSTIKFGELSINEHFGFCFKLIDKKGNYSHSISSFFGDKINEGINYNEQLRLLYVALTRATEKLIISFSLEQNTNSENKLCYKNLILKNFNLLDLERNNLFTINTKLIFIQKANDNFIENEKDYELKIEIVNEIPEITQSIYSEQSIQQTKEKDLQIFTGEIKDQVKEETFTATQLNVYEFCPFKYLLKFIIGYNPFKYHYSEKDEEDLISGAEIGTIFHQLMEKLNSPTLEEAQNVLNLILENYPESIKNEIEEIVLQKFSVLSNDKTFLEIFSNQNCYREFEILIKLHNHILLGIIDRINLEENGITIIDYKTDSFNENELNRKIEEYKTQMEFYVLLVSEFFKQDEKIKLILFFINYPDKVFSRIYSRDEINNIREKFINLLSRIEKSDFEKNLQRCFECEYAINGRCIAG